MSSLLPVNTIVRVINKRNKVWNGKIGRIKSYEEDMGYPEAVVEMQGTGSFRTIYVTPKHLQEVK